MGKRKLKFKSMHYREMTVVLLRQTYFALRDCKSMSVCGALGHATNIVCNHNKSHADEYRRVSTLLRERITGAVGRGKLVHEWLGRKSPDYQAWKETPECARTFYSVMRKYRMAWVKDMIRTINAGGAI